MVLIVMGVSGCGKSTVGSALAGELGWEFIEGDEFHSQASRDKMARGIPLEDADRWPWLRALHGEIERRVRDGRGAVLACSALKRSYRDVLRSGIEDETRVAYLHAPAEVLRSRLETRRGHTFPPHLLDSQLATLEDPTGEPGVIHVDAREQVSRIVASLGRALRKEPA